MKVLVVLPRFPYPLDKGDKLRAFNQIKALSKYNDIYLFSVSHDKVSAEDIEHLQPYCKEIRIVRPPKLAGIINVIRNYFTTKSLQIGYWDSKAARKGYKSFEKMVQPDVLYSQMVRTMPWISRSLVPKVMDFQDALSMNVERRMQAATGLWHYILHYEFKMLRSTEYNAFKIFDALTIISEPDSEAIPHRLNADIHIVPNGVDFEKYKPIDCPKEYDVVFCGNMQYQPNISAVCYLVEQVMPLVWKEMPETKVLLAGASPKKRVRSLASNRVTVTGWVEDIRECYTKSRIFAAPMQEGSGLQNKLLEAMSMKIPCVTTPIANNPLGGTSGQDILVGDDPQTLANHILSLLRDPEAAKIQAEKAYEYVHNHFSWESYGNQLNQILYDVTQKPSKVSLEPKLDKTL